jgi:biopolymer transport protein ExbD
MVPIIRARDEESVIATINTTPLVDVMLVLLIIFLITIPVVVPTIAVDLPREANQPTQTRPDNIVIAVNRDGVVFWNEKPVAGMDEFLRRLKRRSVASPQPEVHIRADRNALYEDVGKVVLACQRAGIVKIGFITQPPSRGTP